MIKKILGATVVIILIACLMVPVITESPRGGENTLDVVVLAGQSNAAYTLGTPRVDADVTNSEIPLPETNCYYFGNTSRPTYHSTDLATCKIYSMLDEDGWHIGGEEASIAYQISKITDNDVLLVNVAVPGQSIDKFLPGTQYGDRINEIVNLALGKIPDRYDVVKCGWVWIQGEGDKTTPVDDYVASFRTIQDNFKTLGFETCYLVKTRADDSGLARDAHNWLIDNLDDVLLASDLPDTFSVSAGTLVDGNAIHYTQYGRDLLGLEIGATIAEDCQHSVRAGDTYAILLIIPAVMIMAILVAVIPRMHD